MGHRVGWNDPLGVGIELMSDTLEASPRNTVRLQWMLRPSEALSRRRS